MSGPRDERLPRGNRGLPPEQIAESQRWRLLVAAGESLLAGGAASATSHDVSRRAGVSTSTFYRHFDDLEDCLLTAHAAAVDSLGDLIAAACTGPGDWLERLGAAIEAAVGFLTAEPAMTRLLGPDVAAAVPAVASARERFLERLAGHLCAGRQLDLARASRLPAATEVHLLDATFLMLGEYAAAGRLDSLPDRAPELTVILSLPYAPCR